MFPCRSSKTASPDIALTSAPSPRDTDRPAPPAPLAADPLGDPLLALGDGGVLAVITAVEGAHYRVPGTLMAFPAAGRAVGQLSSGCIEADLALHARAVARDGRPRRLRYGVGSPFVDLVLPCGGGLEVALVPVADPRPIRRVLAAREARRASALHVDPDSGTIALDGPGLRVPVDPPTLFLTWGAGIEAVTFAALARAAGYPARLSTHDAATAAAATARGVAPGDDAVGALDPWTAVTLFYHDHDREPPILAQALATPAFYVGAQGSLRSHRARIAALRGIGVPDDDIARLRGPIGLIPSARDPQVLAVSVLAEILAERAR